MDLRQLRYFLAIAEEGSITAAAESLHMAQPPLSLQLKQLEEELQVPLVERGSRHSSLTEAGELLRDRAEQILDLARSVQKELLAFNAGLAGTLSLGVVSSSGLPDADVNAFHARYPEVAFELHEGNTYQIIDLLRKGVVEVGIVRTPFDAVGFECRYAELEPMMAVFSGEDPFPGKGRLSIAVLRGRPLVIYRRFERMIVEECEKVGFEPRIACRNDDARTTLGWVRSGYGVGLVPRSALARGGSSLGRRAIDCERLRTQLTAIVVADRYLSPLARRFFEGFRSGLDLRAEGVRER